MLGGEENVKELCWRRVNRNWRDQNFTYSQADRDFVLFFAQLPETTIVNDPIGRWGVTRTFIPRKIHHDIRVCKITNLDLASWQLVTDWEGCEISAFEATTGATVEVKGSLSPNISRLTNLEIAADNNLLSNDVVDYEALERESARARLIFNIILE
jgi:hypothetical protein